MKKLNIRKTDYLVIYLILIVVQTMKFVDISMGIVGITLLLNIIPTLILGTVSNFIFSIKKDKLRKSE